MERKSIDVSRSKTISKKEGIVLGEKCNVSSKEQAEMFCDGVKEAIDVAVKLTATEKKNFQTYCQIKAMPSEIPQEFLDLNNPAVNEIFSDNLINISFVNASTKRSKVADPLYSQRTEGQFIEGQCKIPETILTEKFCKGFEFGMEQFFNLSEPKLNIKEFKARCKPEVNKDTGEHKVFYGLLRYLNL